MSDERENRVKSVIKTLSRFDNITFVVVSYIVIALLLNFLDATGAVYLVVLVVLIIISSFAHSLKTRLMTDEERKSEEKQREYHGRDPFEG